MKTKLIIACGFALTIGCGGAVSPEKPPSVTGKQDSNDGWKHANLTADDGTTIALDYKIASHDYSSDKPDYRSFFDPLWFNVAGVHLTATSKVKVVLVNHVFYDGQCGIPDRDEQTVYDLDLVREPEGHFSGELNSQGRTQWGSTDWHAIGDYQRPLEDGRPYCGHETNSGSEVAVVIDGNWLTDRITQSHNFGVKL